MVVKILKLSCVMMLTIKAHATNLNCSVLSGVRMEIGKQGIKVGGHDRFPVDCLGFFIRNYTYGASKRFL